MKKIILYLIAIIFSLEIAAQDNIKIRGKIELLSSSSEIIIASGEGQLRGKINPDGSFFIQGKIQEPSAGLIQTDSSGADAIWLEPGEYTITCREIKINGIGRPAFRIPHIDGPLNARLYHGFNERQFYTWGSTREETRMKLNQFYTGYIDSIFNTHPATPTLPNMIRLASYSLGDELTKKYVARLDEKQQKDDDTGQINNQLKRNERIEKEKYFRDFEMKDKDGKKFKLASLDKKLVFVDFWSSDCIPCRRKHPRLAELYKKYADKGLEIISISLDNVEKDWENAIIKDNMTWINVSELKGWETSIAEYYFIKSIPFGFWLDKDKKIITTNDLTETQIQKYLE